MLDNSVDFKEQMIETRRTQILYGAAQVFSKKGFHKATTKEIAQAAGVSEGTIYNYFNNKRELLMAMVEMIATRSLKETILDNPPDDPREFFKLLLHDRLQLLQDYGPVLAPLVAEIFADTKLRESIYQNIFQPIVDPLEAYIRDRIAVGRIRPVNPLIVTRGLIGCMALNSALKLTGLEPRYESISPDEMINYIVELMMHGISASTDEEGTN